MKKCTTVLAFVLALALLCTSIVGCGTSPSTAPSASSDTGGAAPQSISTTGEPELYTIEEASGEVVLWFWGDFWEKTFNVFNERYPNVKVTQVPVAPNDYFTKLQTAFVSGSDVPDIAGMSTDYIGKLIRMDVWENLEEAPYDLDRSTLIDYTVPLCTGVEGGIVSIESGVSPAGLAYKRDMAREYLGTDDPDEIEKMLSDHESFIKKGQEVHEASGGTVYFLPSVGDAYNMLYYQQPDVLVENGTVLIKEKLLTRFETIRNMLDTGVCDKLEIWSPAWNAAFDDKTHLFEHCAPWVPVFLIEPNAPDSVGNWGLIDAPGGNYLTGGVPFGIPKGAKNKHGAWAALKWAFQTIEGSEVARDIQCQTTVYKPAAAIPGFYDVPNKYFGDQPWLPKLADSMNDCTFRPTTEYDQIVFDAMDLARKALTAGASAEEALDIAEDEVVRKAPELKKE